MHLLVGKPAMEALVTDIYVEAETHFMAFCKIFWLLQYRLFGQQHSRSKPSLWLFVKQIDFCNRGFGHTHIC